MLFRSNTSRIVDTLLDAGADIDIRDTDGRRAADYAQENKNLKSRYVQTRLGAEAGGIRQSDEGSGKDVAPMMQFIKKMLRKEGSDRSATKSYRRTALPARPDAPGACGRGGCGRGCTTMCDPFGRRWPVLLSGGALVEPAPVLGGVVVERGRPLGGPVGGGDGQQLARQSQQGAALGGAAARGRVLRPVGRPGRPLEAAQAMNSPGAACSVLAGGTARGAVVVRLRAVRLQR